MLIFGRSSLFHCGFMIEIMLKEHSAAVTARLKKTLVMALCVQAQ